MAGTMGTGFHAPQQTPRWDWQRQLKLRRQRWLQQQQQQQPPGGQMGTRGIGGEQGQPLSPGDFQGGFQGQQPGGVQGQVGPQQDSGIAQPSDVTPQEKAVLRGVLDILKEGRVAMSTGATDELMDQRLTAAQAYLSGFMEAKGQEELGGYLETIPPLSTRGILDDGEYDQMIDDLEQLLDPETRFIPFAAVAGAVAVNLASTAIWEGGKWGVNKWKKSQKKKR